MKRWNITPEQKKQIVDEMMRLVEGKDKAIAIRAARLLIACEEQNLKAANAEPSEDDRNRFAEIMRRIRSGEGN